MNTPQLSFRSLATKTIVCHTIAYVIIGALATHFLNYAAEMARPESGMRPFSDQSWLVLFFNPFAAWSSRWSSIRCGSASLAERLDG
jgi:hypothetical protein